jgi:hypothetical protein
MAITMLQSENGEYKNIRAFLSCISGKKLFSFREIPVFVSSQPYETVCRALEAMSGAGLYVPYPNVE